MSDITRILHEIEHGQRHRAEQLLPLVYEELRKLAAQKMSQEKPSTMQATALVHEAYIRVVGRASTTHWDSRGHFFAAAAEAMRRILIDQVRRKRAAKRGGSRHRIELDECASVVAPDDKPVEDLLALDEALKQFEAEEPLKAKLVKLRYFAGVPLDDAARMIGISPATAKRYWVYARSWLYGKLHGD